MEKQEKHGTFDKMVNLHPDTFESIINGERLERVTIEDELCHNNKYLPWTIYPENYSRKFLVEKFNEVFGASIK